MLAAHDKQTRTTEGDLGGGPAGVSTAAVLDGRGTTVGKLVRDLLFVITICTQSLTPLLGRAEQRIRSILDISY